MRILYCLLLFLPLPLCAQSVRLKGTVQDQAGEKLPNATILVLPDSVFELTSVGGEFGFKIPAGRKEFYVLYTGYETLQLDFRVASDTVLKLEMIQKVSQLAEVVVTGDRFTNEDIVQSTRTGTNLLSQQDITAIPVLGGEADLIKTLQLLPGTLRGVEGSSDLFVRGGAADQNLVLLDGAPIYNTSHLFGFLSVFNPNTLSQVEAINGGFPAQYGGRLSSILDVRTNSTIAARTYTSGEIGLLSSRVYVEQPLVKEKASLWVAGRRTYVDQVAKALRLDIPYYFYDLNGKLILKPTHRDHIELSYYGGEDILDIFRDRNNDGNGMLTSYASGNTSQSLHWKHAFSGNWISSTSLFRTSYRYRITNAFDDNEVQAFSDIGDLGAKIIFEKDSVWKKYNMKTGVEWIRHSISPNILNSAGTIAELLESHATAGKTAQEVAVFVQQDWPIAQRWRFNIGFRGSAGIVEGTQYFFPEPRLSSRYDLGNDQALKFSYSSMTQYMHRISNSAISMPTDVWYPITDSIAPQRAHQFSIAWQKFLPKKKMYFSAEAYYKPMRNLVGYEEGTNLFFNNDFEKKLIQGKGRAYGLEILVRKDAGKFTGWISYTLSWAWRQYDQINEGRWFHARYDRRHNGAIVAQYILGRRWAASMVWEFISGARFTPVVGQYTVLAPTLTGIDLIPLYSGTNAVKLADTHRLDIGVKFMSKPEKKFQWQLFAGIYNTYNRANPVGIVIERDEESGSLKYSQPGLFGLLPFVSYGFKF